MIPVEGLGLDSSESTTQPRTPSQQLGAVPGSTDVLLGYRETNPGTDNGDDKEDCENFDTTRDLENLEGLGTLETDYVNDVSDREDAGERSKDAIFAQASQGGGAEGIIITGTGTNNNLVYVYRHIGSNPIPQAVIAQNPLIRLCWTSRRAACRRRIRLYRTCGRRAAHVRWPSGRRLPVQPGRGGDCAG